MSLLLSADDLRLIYYTQQVRTKRSTADSHGVAKEGVSHETKGTRMC